MTDARAWLEERQALASKATDGPWEAYADPGGPREAPFVAVEVGDTEVRVVRFEGGHFDGAFIADARTSVPRMASALRAVLDLHPDVHGECHMCSDERGPKPFPCPTRRAVEAALGGEE